MTARIAAAFGTLLVAALSGCTAGSVLSTTPEIRANAAIDSWHRAAATGDLEAYQRLMTPNVVFLGTDKTERWVGDEFIEFCRPYFDGPKPYGEGAWTYKPIDRHVRISSDRKTAWFDELLVNDAYGHCRGTGVLRGDGGDRWRIAHYSLTFLIPNDIAKSIVGQVRAYESSQPPTQGAD